LIKGDYEIRQILLQVSLIVLIAFIPIYLYMSSSLENKELKDRLYIKEQIYILSSSISKLAKKESLIIDSSDIEIYLFDKNENTIFKNSDTNIPLKDNLCIKEELASNILEARYIEVCKDIDNTQVIINVLALCLLVIFLVFVSLFIIIKQSIEPYKRLNKYLDEFLKDVMHEIKTPIGVAKFNVDMLSMRTKEDKYLLRIKSALKNMTVIYEDLEYYIKQNTINDEIVDIDFSEFLNKRCEFFKDLSNAKNIKLERYIEEDITIFISETELHRIIDNTISNAIKYSKNDTLIKISLCKEQSNILFVVQDQGIGIKDTKKIFYRYYRGDNVNGGFGIGLSIVKKICDKNKINIHVESKVGKGSVFKYKFRI